MKDFISNRKTEIMPTVATLIILDLLCYVILKMVDSYVILSLIKVILILCNAFYIYHIGAWISVDYIIKDSYLIITAWGGLKKVKVKISDINSYTIQHGRIKGVELSGISSNKFAIGRIVVKSLGTTRMFVTDNDNVFYLHTDDINYGISPKDVEGFEALLKAEGVENRTWTIEYNKVHKLYKEKKYIIPLVITSILILVITFLPITLYVVNKLPDVMPLAINGNLTVAKMGSDKQFAFAQMLYGILNMAVMFCMYFASHFCARYDKKTAYRYLYIALIVAVTFLYLQILMLQMSI